jgi:hypothetical protein
MFTYGSRVNLGDVVARRWFRANTAASLTYRLRRWPWRNIPKKMTSRAKIAKHPRKATGSVNQDDCWLMSGIVEQTTTTAQLPS